MKKETLRQRQSRFANMIPLLLLHARQLGYEVTFGDAWAKSGHMSGSLHYARLAIDLNLFRRGKYLRTTKSHTALGEYWESIGGTWGGRRSDGNHYSLGPYREKI